MLRRIRSLAKNHGKSVLLCTHILHDIREICENVVILSRGTVRVMESLAKLSQPAEPGLQIQVRDRRQVLAESLTQKGLCVQKPRGWISVGHRTRSRYRIDDLECSLRE